jgi:hypothetical protein
MRRLRKERNNKSDILTRGVNTFSDTLQLALHTETIFVLVLSERSTPCRLNTGSPGKSLSISVRRCPSIQPVAMFAATDALLSSWYGYTGENEESFFTSSSFLR